MRGAALERQTRYPGVFYSVDRSQRISVSAYQGHKVLTFGWLLENKPGGVWMELEMTPDEAEVFAATILKGAKLQRAASAQPLEPKD